MFQQKLYQQKTELEKKLKEKRSCLFAISGITDAQNCGDWRGSLQSSSLTPLFKAGSATKGCSGLCTVGFWTSLRMETLQPLCNPVECTITLKNILFLCCCTGWWHLLTVTVSQQWHISCGLREHLSERPQALPAAWGLQSSTLLLKLHLKVVLEWNR